MKKKIIISIIGCLILAVVTIGFIIWDNRTISTITLDINPSIEINLNRKGKVKSVIALNEDANKIVSNNLKGKTLDETLNVIVENLIENDYVQDNNLVDVILYSNGNVSNDEISRILSTSLGDKNIPVNIITIENITEEDKGLAEEYNVSPAKVAYVKTVTEEKDSIDIDDLANKSVSEIKETKATGRYCEEGWTLEGDFCLKEKERITASNGEVCPQEYYEIDGKCYGETAVIDTDELLCNEGFKLENGKCFLNEVTDAIPNKYSCTTGELAKTSDYGLAPIDTNNAEYVCIDKSSGQAPVLRCLYNPGHIMIGDKCYNGPAPLINGGCPGADLAISGWCYSLDDEDQWQCPNGSIYHKSKGGVPVLCPDTLKVSKATVTEYRCEGDFTLQGDKCILERIEDPRHKRVCPVGYTKTEDDRCINYEKTANKEDGFICNQENSRLNGNTCIIYEIVEVKRS